MLGRSGALLAVRRRGADPSIYLASGEKALMARDERFPFGGGIDHYVFPPPFRFWIFFWIFWGFFLDFFCIWDAVDTDFSPGRTPPTHRFFARTDEKLLVH